MADKRDQSDKTPGFTVTDRRAAGRDEGEPSNTASPPSERAAAAQAGSEATDAREASGARAEESRGGGTEGAADRLPAIDFATLIMSLATSALAQLGELSMGGEPPKRNLPLAKQTIDIIGMLEEKTRGNLTADEAQLLQHMLYDLRLKYVDTKKERAGQ